MTDLSAKYPTFWQSSDQTMAIWNALGKEIDQMQENFADLVLQCDVNQATWGLDLWEERVGLTSNADKSYDDRRSAILAKLRGTGTVTVAMIQNLAESFSYGTAEIIEDVRNYHFDIRFISTVGTPPNMADLTAAIEEVKPAHLTYAFIYNFTLWERLELNSWEHWEDYTWDDILEGEFE